MQYCFEQALEEAFGKVYFVRKREREREEGKERKWVSEWERKSSYFLQCFCYKKIDISIFLLQFNLNIN